MTHLLYLTNSYLQTFEARLTAIHPESGALIFDQTAFYPGGGGQPHDLGTLTFDGQTAHVIKVRKHGDDVLHFLAPNSPIPTIGQNLHAQLDWARRYALMRTHTAMHILCGCVFRDYGALVTGGEMEPLKGRMDFEFENLTKELVGEIEAAVNREVIANRPLRVAVLPREQAFQIPDLIRTKINLLPEGITEVRTVEIVGLDLQADGGTHVASTAEVGKIRVVDYKSKGKINKRIYIELN